MNNVRNLLIGLCLAAASVGAMAQNTDEHSTHHPADAPSAAATEKTVSYTHLTLPTTPYV